MQRRALADPKLIAAVLILQVLPLLLFPAASFSPTTQEWWLPVLLVIMVIAADIYLIAFRTASSWPWTLIAFAQGFNIISRLMMVWPHSADQVGTAWVLNVPYIALTLISVAMSAALLWYTEMPDVRMGLLRD